MIKDISVVLLGAGRSLRFKSQTIKQNFKIHNKTLFSYSRDFFNRYFSHSQRYLVVNSKVKITNLHDHEKVILGSSSRIRSLNKCLRYLDKNNLFTKYILIHDIARPILNITDIEALINEMKFNIDGSSLGYPMTNAIKEIKKNKITNISRDNLWMSFTPQIFKTVQLYNSVQHCLSNNYMVDDDIETLLLNNLKCSIIKSSPTNIKVTYISDIPYIERLL